MAFKLGSTDINQIYLGSTDIKKVYLGSTLIHDTTGGGGWAGPTIVASTTIQGNATNQTISMPTTVLSGDLILVAFAARGNDTFANPTAPSANTWGFVGYAESNTNSSGARCQIWAYPASGGETSVTTVGTGNTGLVQVYVVRGATSGTSYAQVNNGSGTSGTPTIASASTTNANALIFGLFCDRVDSTVDDLSAVVNGNVANLTELGVDQTDVGGGTGLLTFSGELASVGAVGSTTCTKNTSGHWAGVVVEIW